MNSVSLTLEPNSCAVAEEDGTELTVPLSVL